MVEKVRIDIDAAEDLGQAYRNAGRHLDDMADDLAGLFAEANQLLDHCISPDVINDLRDLADDLRSDHDDLQWRADFLESVDGPIDVDGRRIDYLPANRPPAPPMGSAAAAEWVAAIVGTWNGSDGKPATIDDLTDIQHLLETARHKPEWLTRFFRELGPVATYQLSAMVTVLVRDQITSEVLHQAEPTLFDPAAFRRALADSLALASTTTREPRVRRPGADPQRYNPLGDYWFDDLRQAGTTYHGEVSTDWVRLFDTDTRLHPEWVDALATTGLEIVDGQQQLEVAWTEHREPHTGLWVIDPTHQHDSDLLQILFNPAINTRGAATNALLQPTANGRTGAQIVTARNYDNSDVGIALSALTLAGTMAAMNDSIHDGHATDPVLAENAMRATGAVIEAIALEEAFHSNRPPYDGARTLAFGTIIVAALPHAMTVGDTGLDTGIYTPGQPIPSASSGIEIEADNLALAMGALFRNEPMRNYLGAEANIAMRQQLLDPTDSDHHAIGEMNGVLVYALNRANITAAEAQQAAIDNFNSTADQIWNTVEFVADEIPFGKPVVKVIRQATSYLDVIGIDLQQEVIDAAFNASSIDTSLPSPEDARITAQLNMDSAYRNANRTILAAEIDRTQTLLTHGTPIENLPESSIAILDAMQATFGDNFTPGHTTYAELALNPTTQHHLASIAQNLASLPELTDEFIALERGLAKAPGQ